MRTPEFITLVEEIIQPVLERHGFQRVTMPDGWITPAVLFESRNRWFGASWDWRDRYFDASLGRLFWFPDGLPRVIVRGPLSVAKVINSENDADFVRNVLERIAHRLPEVLERFDELYAQSTTISESMASPQKAASKAARQFGTEVTLEKWRQLAEQIK